MKEKHPPKNTSICAVKHAMPSADFTLEDWNCAPREFRFVGWRDDYSAFFLLDEHDGQFVLEPVFILRQGLMRFGEPPTGIIKTRLLPPPFRSTRAEADLLREFRHLPDARTVRNVWDARNLYRREARKRGLQSFRAPKQWELVYEDVLAPDKSVETPAKPQSIQDWRSHAKKLEVLRDTLARKWVKQNGLDADELLRDKNEFFKCHEKDFVPCNPEPTRVRLIRPATLANNLLMIKMAGVHYKMEFNNLVTIWLTDFRGPQIPQSTTDLDQIRKLLDARPVLVCLTPEAAEKELELTPGPRHRILKSYCEAAQLDVNNLTRADLPALMAVARDRRKAQGRAGSSVQKRRIRNS